ncbi:MAG TPA: hypothetical protein VIS96_18625 [Terrimicrobiaceae bacterium]
MKNACLIQDVRRVELTNLVSKGGGPPCIAGDLADQHVSPSLGDASLVIDGEEFAGNVVQCTEHQIIFEPARYEEVAKKIS